jgi:gas vesicle protein
MKDDKGKVILSLLAGATAGIVAGLLLAPETGTDARAGIRRSASRWSDDLSKLFKDTVAKAKSTAGHTNPDAAVSEDKAAADRLLEGLSTADAVAGDPTEVDSDYDATGSDARHQPVK